MARRDAWRRRTLQSLSLDLDDEIVLFALAKANREDGEMRRLLERTRHVCGIQFNLNYLSDQECLVDFRFKKTEVGRIANMIGWTGKTERNGYRCDMISASCIMFQRLSNASRWSDLEKRFGLFSSQMCEIFYEMIERFVQSFGYALHLNGQLLRRRAEMYAESIRNAGAPLHRCVGFIDCTKVRMQRPGGHGSLQRSVYSGHKRMHCLIYQTLTTPDGLMFALYGPEEGRRHDITLYRHSEWEAILSECLHINGQYYYIFGDSAYMLRPWMQRLYSHGIRTPEQAEFNGKMSTVRVAVEHNYKDLKQYWTSQDFARNLKVRLTPIAMLYKASALLLNFHVCLYGGGQVGCQFDVKPPTLLEYLNIHE